MMAKVGQFLIARIRSSDLRKIATRAAMTTAAISRAVSRSVAQFRGNVRDEIPLRRMLIDIGH